jgi:alpha-beta hydrolase superfamily lysophospholipase
MSTRARQAIAEVDEPVVLCGHSYGGVIITEAGADDRVARLLYVTSVMPDARQSQADVIRSEPACGWRRTTTAPSAFTPRHDPGVVPAGLR